jgi:hypothetical protein
VGVDLAIMEKVWRKYGKDMKRIGLRGKRKVNTHWLLRCIKDNRLEVQGADAALV